MLVLFIFSVRITALTVSSPGNLLTGVGCENGTITLMQLPGRGSTLTTARATDYSQNLRLEASIVTKLFPTSKLYLGHTTAVNILVISLELQLLISCDATGDCLVHSLADAGIIRRISFGQPVQSLKLHPGESAITLMVPSLLL